MPLYEFRCEKCGGVSAFREKMFERQPLFFGRRRCTRCGSRKLSKIMSRVAGHVERTYNEQLNELKSMGNVTFIPEEMMKRPEPPGGVCPYHQAHVEEEKKQAAAEADKKAKSPIVLSS